MVGLRLPNHRYEGRKPNALRQERDTSNADWLSLLYFTGISNRTTIADGNTWNHEHIALLGLALTTDIDEGYEIGM